VLGTLISAVSYFICQTDVDCRAADELLKTSRAVSTNVYTCIIYIRLLVMVVPLCFYVCLSKVLVQVSVLS